jgi:hypothetical protein
MPQLHVDGELLRPCLDEGFEEDFGARAHEVDIEWGDNHLGTG